MSDHPRPRHWSTYETPGEYWADYAGRVPLPMMVALSGVMRERGVTFAEAYALLLEAGAIIELRPRPRRGRSDRGAR